jgi:putative ABC transport system permease protein
MRSRLRLVDVLRTATLGIRSRRLRAALSALGISLGIASIVAVLGVTGSSEAHLQAELNQLGTNLLVVTNGQALNGSEAELPSTATAMIGQMANVQNVAPTAQLTANVYRSSLVPAGQTGGIAVRATNSALLPTLQGSLRAGWYFNPGPYPDTVLGYQAAVALGITGSSLGTRIWLGGHWFSVSGILNPFPLAPEIDSSALVSFASAKLLLGYNGHPSRIYVRANPDHVTGVYSLLPDTTDPQSPFQVNVTQPSNALTAQIAAKNSAGTLFLGLGAIALVVGTIGIANVMVISVLERRGEIGLRRALGATRPQVGIQFLTESLALSVLGGTLGLLIGTAVTVGIARYHGWSTAIPARTVWGSLAVAVVAGALAGLYPALRAARLSPTSALRSI